MVSIDLICPLKEFRKFLILSCCRSFIPREYLEDEKVFPERLEGAGLIYTEAEDKATLKKIRDVQFVHVGNVITVIYNSKSGSTRLRWEHKEADRGRLTGEASIRSVMKLVEAGIITEDTVKRSLKEKPNP